MLSWAESVVTPLGWLRPEEDEEPEEDERFWSKVERMLTLALWVDGWV